MWLFTTEGFLSVVADRSAPAGERLLVRARRREHLETLLPQLQPFQLSGSDYAWRAWCNRDDLRALLMAQVDNLHYTNFKAAVRDRPYHDACLNVWQAMHRYQR